MTEHAPGPWRYAKSEGYILSPKGGVLAILMAGSDRSRWGDIDGEGDINEFDANGTLLAEAPNLLKAVQDAIGMLQWATGGWGNTREQDLVEARATLFQRYIPQLESAIAKARGTEVVPE